MLALHTVRWLLSVLEVVIAIPIFYLSIVSISAILAARKHASKTTSINTSERVNFAILIPAHNEIAVLGNLLESLTRLDYAEDHYAIHVVADNCTDTTAELASATDRVHVYERFDQVKRGKGYALNWLFQQLKVEQLRYDAYIILDADSVVEPAFLQAMNKMCLQGARALQARYTVLNGTESSSAALRWIALSLMNYVRPLGRNGLGVSSTLTGNGMCFSHDLLEQHPWQAFSITEDYQYYLDLVQNGERVCYVQDAIVRSVMPTTFAQMRTQDIRWEAYGGSQPTWKTAWNLLKVGLSNRDPVRLEAIVELLTPPLSYLVVLCLLALTGSLIAWSMPGLLFGILLIGGLAFYIGTAMYLLHPPRIVYKALLHAPAFILWKLWVILVLRRSKRHNSEWIRTSRTA